MEGVYKVREIYHSNHQPPACRSTKKWHIEWRVSSADFPQSNGRAEAAVKTGKRLLCNNTERGSQIDTEGVANALFQ